MKTSSMFVLATASLLCVGALCAAPVSAFTAHYQLLKDGNPIGETTLTLAPADGNTWAFVSASHGTSGLAALLGADLTETSNFRWKDGLPEGLSYDYKMDAAIKHKERHVRFDWNSNTISVDDKGQHTYPAQPGTMERHTIVLAIAAGLVDNKTSFAFPVAVRDRVETQHYAVKDKKEIKVPAGQYDAMHVVRADGGGFDAWFSPKLPVPVEVSQDDGGTYTLKLESYNAK